MPQLVYLGQEVRDRLTGFSGVVTGRAEYITGCAQICVDGPGDPAPTK